MRVCGLKYVYTKEISEVVGERDGYGSLRCNCRREVLIEHNTCGLLYQWSSILPLTIAFSLFSTSILSLLISGAENINFGKKMKIFLTSMYGYDGSIDLEKPHPPYLQAVDGG